jgi:hypothetical protein
LRIVPLPHDGLTANDDDRGQMIKNHHHRPLARERRACSGVRWDHRLCPGLGCGIRRFRFRVAVQRDRRTKRRNAEGRAFREGYSGDDAR